MRQHFYQQLSEQFDPSLLSFDLINFDLEVVLPPKSNKLQLIDFLGEVQEEFVVPFDPAQNFDLEVVLPPKDNRLFLNDLTTQELEPSTYIYDLIDFDLPPVIPPKFNRLELRDLLYGDMEDWTPPAVPAPDMGYDIVFPEPHLKQFIPAEIIEIETPVDLLPPLFEQVSFKQYTPSKIIKLRSQFPDSNQYISPNLPNTALSFFPDPNEVYYVPIVIPYPVKIIELGVYVIATQPGTQARLGIYSLERGVVSKLIDSNITTLNSIGFRACPMNVNLDAGAYCFAFLTDATTAKLKKADNFSFLFGNITPDEGVAKTHYYSSQPWANGMVDNPIAILRDGNVPMMWAKIQ